MNVVNTDSATVRLTENYVTKRGQNVKLFMVDGGGAYPVKGVYECVGIVQGIPGIWRVSSWTEFGKNIDDDSLTLVRKKKIIDNGKWWIPVWNDMSAILSRGCAEGVARMLYISKERCDKAHGTDSRYAGALEINLTLEL